MKIYTKTGDEGCTFMPSVGKVDKYHCSVDAQGEIDELNAWLGHVLCKYPKLTFLEDVQVVLMQIGAQLALSKQMVLEINIKKVENQIDEIEAKLPDLTNFIIPGFPSEIHIARTVCRSIA